MKSLFAAAALLAASPAFAGEPEGYDVLIEQANAAYSAGDWAGMATALDAAQNYIPYSLHITRFRILAYSELGDFEEALAIARTVAKRGLSLALEGKPGFDALRAQPDFAPIAEQMSANLAPAGEADIIETVNRDSLLPESVVHAVIGGKDRYYVGAVRTGGVYAGKALHAKTNGGVYGLKIVDGLIWTVENTRAPYAGKGAGAETSGFHAYDVATGKERCTVPLEGGPAVLGALETTPFGLVASDSLTPRLVLIEGCDSEPRVISEDPRFANLQGVAYDPGRKRLYVADYLAGLFSVDLETGATESVINAADAHLGGIDGLSFYKRDLVGVQNGTLPQRIVRLHLSEKGDAVAQLDVLQQALPEWNEPTNGTIAGDAFVYVATSNWPAYAEDGSEVEGAQRQPLRLISVPLD